VQSGCSRCARRKYNLLKEAFSSAVAPVLTEYSRNAARVQLFYRNQIKKIELEIKTDRANN